MIQQDKDMQGSISRDEIQNGLLLPTGCLKNRNFTSKSTTRAVTDL